MPGTSKWISITVLILAACLVGCQQKDHPGESSFDGIVTIPINGSGVITETIDTPDNEDSGPTNKDDENNNNFNEPEKQIDDNLNDINNFPDQDELDQNTPVQTDSEQAPPESEPETEDNANLPLLNIYIGQSIAEVGTILKSEYETYTMQDPEGVLTVREYNGFSIGFNSSDQVEFIDIYSERVDPGLNGIRIGNTAADAIAAIGEPSNANEYVMNYLNEDIIMKMDLDPADSTIHSIKMFAK